MTAFDIYSAVGGVGEDILEESETVPKKKITKIIPLMTAAACFAVFAAGLSHALRSDNIEQPVTDISNITSERNADETYPAETDLDGTVAAGGDVTSNAVTSPDPQITGDGIVIYDPSAQTTSVSLFNTETEQIQTGEQTQTAHNAVMEETTSVPIDFTPTEIDEDEIALIPKWEDLSDLDRYVYLSYGGNEYSITMEKFDKSELTFLRNAEIYGIDEYTDKKYSMECAVYKIGNVNPNYMVAVLTADGKYTGFEQFPYRADTLADYLTDTDFLNRNKTGFEVAVDDDENRCKTVYTLTDLPDVVEKLLTAAPDTPPTSDNPWTLTCYFIFDTNGKQLMRVYGNGYIYFCNRIFNIGTVNTDAFIDYVKENAAKVETVPYDEPDPNDITIPE